MTEFELKFHVPPGGLAGVRAAMRPLRPVRGRLQAVYYDSPDGRLAAQGLVLRLRREGRRWVQAAKAPGHGLLERLEHEVMLPPGAPPLVDPARHAGSPLRRELERSLAGAPAPGLQPVFATDVRRATCTVAFEGAIVEIALDVGEVRAAGASAPLCEIEFELKDGKRSAAIELARRWAAAHGLWLDTVSKGVRGQRLACGATYGEPVFPVPVAFGAAASGPEVFAAVAAGSLTQVLANAAEVAAGCRGEEHVHQLRVGLRRLRTALRELGALSVTEVGSDLDAGLAAAFRELGMQRDRASVFPDLARRMAAAGGPPLTWDDRAVAWPDVGAVARAPAFQDVLLRLLGVVVAQAETPAAKGPDPRAAVCARLRKLHRGTVAEGSRFRELAPQERHRLRKRVKRLRYLAESVRCMFRPRQVDRYVEALKEVQDRLGEYVDECSALLAWQERARAEPSAWFGVGWLTARTPGHELACEHACRTFARRATPFWA